LAAPQAHATDNRAFYEYNPAALGLAPNMSTINGNPSTNAHRHTDANTPAATYAITNHQFNRDQLIQRNIDMYATPGENYNLQSSNQSINPYSNSILTSYSNGYHHQ